MQNIRNFAIVAHIDHGKSTLADRLLELTGTVSARQMRNQLLDSNPIERERGITIKLAPVRMLYSQNSTLYTLNLIDTPGHVDFSYEVSRSLAACEGAVLLVDATQGVQAQTLAHFHTCQKLGLTIIPVINKIDIPSADIAATQKQISEILHFDPESVLSISAKTGSGIAELLQEIIHRIPPPTTSDQPPTTIRALVFNSNFDPHMGVIAWIRVIDGQISPHEKLYLLASKFQTSIIEIGVFTPDRKPVDSLSAGEVGYVVTNLKDLSQLTVGDTLCNQVTSNPLPGYIPIQPVVFIGLYPTNGVEINALRTALGKLKLSDSALTYTPEFSLALGNGFRLGLLGLLHADIVQERLEREFGLSLIATAPSVSYKLLTSNSQVLTISKVSDFPDPTLVKEIQEPMMTLNVFSPHVYLGAIMQLCQNHRGTLLNVTYLGLLANLQYLMPFSELIRGLNDSLKSVSSGYASLDYELAGYQVADLVKLDVLVAGETVDALSQIVPRSQSPYIARDLVEKLKDLIPRQNFEIPVQAVIGGKILARSDIKPYRKDVTAKLYGGDQTRKDKLLKKQKKGKARMKTVGRVQIPQEAFLSILKI